MVPGAALAAVAKQAEQLRIDGNFYFSKDRFGAAIDAYTEAITLCPNVPIYWSNRALCHRRRNDWTKVEADCRKAIQLDHNSVKAHYMLGLALLQRKEYTEGVKELEKALDLGRGANPKSYMVEEIWQELAKAKYLEWEQASSKRSWELQCLKYVLPVSFDLWFGKVVWLVDNRFVYFVMGCFIQYAYVCLREACETALQEKHAFDISQSEGFLDESTNSHLKQMEALGKVFMIAAEADTRTEVPDYLCCNITLDIFRDPVITPSGITYERAVILEHLQKVGKFDPVTREPLYPSQLVPNLAIKEAVQAFLEKHSWAYKTN